MAKTPQASASSTAVSVGRVGAGRRAQLLDIAAGLFATKGYAQTTVRDIADEAGILSGSLYHHFESKEAMLDEILRNFLIVLVAQFEAIERESPEPQAALVALIDGSFQAISMTPHAVAVYQDQVEVLGAEPGFAYVAESSREIEAIWVRVLLAGQRSGVFRSDVDMKIIYRFIRDAVWSSVRWYRPRGEYEPRTVATQYLSMVRDGLLTK
jgi:AcrR family transcriptional regulator